MCGPFNTSKVEVFKIEDACDMGQVTEGDDSAAVERVTELEGELKGLRRQVDASQAEAQRLRGLLQAVEAARDSITADLTARTETAATLKQVLVYNGSGKKALRIMIIF